MSKNLYKLLGVSKNASTEEIKKAYRKKALRCHPDKTGELPETARKLAEEEFKLINDAHQTLTDSNRRQQYDLGDANYSYADQPDTTYTYQTGSTTFESSAHNGRVKLTGASKSEWTVHNRDFKNQTHKVTLEIAKNSLDPVLEHLNELVEALNNSTTHKVDELNTDMTWYIKQIEEEYNSSLPYGH